MIKMKPRSCDTFVVLPPGTKNDCVVFGKNSDRPSDEVQEVIHVPAADHPSDSKVKCTYIEIDQIPHTHSVILSKPSWMWGAEMGANEHGVCIGNEAVWTKLNSSDDAIERLLGMDLLRLGLERAATAEEAVRIIASLLKTHGQGGNCSDTLEDFTYHNSFLIADPTEAWVLETAGRLWAAQKVISGVRNISNELSIGSNITDMSPDLHDHAIMNKLWDGRNTFSFKMIYGLDADYESHRYKCGRRLLTRLSSEGKFRETDMFKVLRDKPSGICMSDGGFVSTGSQVSTLYKSGSGKPCCHWFTGTPDPLVSVFKPFIFTDCIEYPLQIVSPNAAAKHILYEHHEDVNFKDRKSINSIYKKRLDIERNFVSKVEEIDNDFESHKITAGKLFKDCVDEELTLYS